MVMDRKWLNDADLLPPSHTPNLEIKVEMKEELVSMVERLRRSPQATERVDWSRLDSRDLIQ